MPLSQLQFDALKAAVIADPTASAFRLAGDTFSLRLWCNADSANVVWRTFTAGDAIRNAILWANMTPADAADASATYTNRALYAQAKQISLQTMLQGVSQVNTGVVGIRNGLQDCLTQLPTGAAGATIAAGWTAVRATMQRFATRCESLFTVGQGTAATPVGLVYEGAVSQDEANRLIA